MVLPRHYCARVHREFLCCVRRATIEPNDKVANCINNLHFANP